MTGKGDKGKAMTKQNKLILDYIYDHEKNLSSRVFLTQPLGSGQVRNYTWSQVLEEARSMAAHLQSRGFKNGERISILSKNCAHFFIAELAIWMAGCTTVAIFPTETAQTIRYVLDHSEASLVFIGKLDGWPDQESGIPDKMPCIAMPISPKTMFDKWEDIVAKTPPLTGCPERKADDLAMIVYTSGSTGEPKGVMHDFEHVTRASEVVCTHVLSELGEQTELRSLSYLPLAHIFERVWIEGGAWISGMQHVFFAESLETFLADLNRARPTLFISVPRLWLKFQLGVFAKMPPKKLDRLLAIPILGKLVGRKIRRGLGLDQVKLAGSGSAPIPPELISWYRRIGLNLMEGYAMTEDLAISHTSTPQINAPGYVGPPMPGVQVRISDEGEILIKSPGTMVGYYKRPDLTAEAFTPDGFFKTGDRGERRADGALKITGRVKELFKTAKGKYVAPVPIENRINAHPLIEMSVVSGVGREAAYAMVVLAEDIRAKISDPTVRKHVESELSALLKSVNNDLAEYEQLRMIVVAATPWAIENGLLTPTMKIRRNRIEADVAAKLEGWYSNKQHVIWA